MILKSTIKGKQWLTLECAKAKLTEGSVVEIPDEFYDTAEVQGAIKLNMIELVGDPPPKTLKEGPDETKVRFRNAWHNKLTFDCLKDYVDVGRIILIPVSKVSQPEIQNAIMAGMMEDVDGVLGKPSGRGPAVDLEELTANDIVEKPAIQKRARPAVKDSSKAKPIKSSHADSESDEAESGESRIIDNKPKKKSAPKAEEKHEVAQGEPFSYLDIFDSGTPTEGSF
jgi:hypothetical protein